VRVLATHSIRQFPLHFPSRASPCATRFRTSSNSPSLLMAASLWRRNYDSRGEVWGKPARVGGKPFDL